MIKGSYKAIITADDGMYYVYLTYEGKAGVPGMKPRYYATKASAERGARKMLGKV